MVTIGCWAGFWGDTPRAAAQVLHGAELDYLVADHLAEITMALLARARLKDPNAGYIPDIVKALAPLLGEIHDRGVKVITNGGGLNPAACAQALRAAAAEAGVPMTVAHVEGDDVSGRIAEMRAAGVRDMFTGEELPESPLTANVYLGARPIAAALDAGAQIVVTGRCTDSAIVLGPLIHEFGWTEDDHDLLSAGTLAGHIVECGPQGLGGLFTDWSSVPGWEDMGYPIAECRADGTAVITKPPETGGLVTIASVAEQILYEIGDPGAYVMPDVVCDWRGVHLEQDGPDRVRVSGARGTAPTQTYKATITALDGFRYMAGASFFGIDARGRAQRAGEAALARAGRLAAGDGFAPYTHVSVEVIGGDDAVFLNIAARHPEPGPLELLGREMTPLALVAQGMAGYMAARPKPQPVVRLFHALIDRPSVRVTLTIGERDPFDVTVASGVLVAPGSPPLSEDTPTGVATGATVPLREIAYARSGDKGNDANIGVIARRPEFAALIREQVTAERVAAVFGERLEGPVTRWELPGLNAINILLHDVLGGRGGVSSLRLDPQGKSYAAMLLALPVTVPAA
jgi:Acyclic terpene utilisation family protein AtuA